MAQLKSTALHLTLCAALISIVACSVSEREYPSRVRGKIVSEDGQLTGRCELIVTPSVATAGGDVPIVARAEMEIGKAFDVPLSVSAEAPPVGSTLALAVSCEKHVPKPFMIDWQPLGGLRTPVLDLGEVRIRKSVGY